MLRKLSDAGFSSRHYVTRVQCEFRCDTHKMIPTWWAKRSAISTSFLLLPLVLTASASPADTLGFIQQKFSYISFDKGEWDRSAHLPCYVYAAKQDGAVVEILRIGASNLVPFKAAKGLTVTVCGDSAAFDEGFDAGTPISNKPVSK